MRLFRVSSDAAAESLLGGVTLFQSPGTATGVVAELV
jgi:hypothetical protein